MTKDFYEILGLDKTAIPEEIKKTYRKLAQKWHPDKWSSKSIEERKRANEKMQELNKAYEILGDEDKKKRYDSGETNFTPEFDWDSYYEAEKARIDAELERLIAKREKLKLMRKILAYREMVSSIRFEMFLEKVFEEHLDSNLWVPYSSWEEKLRSLEVVVDENCVVDEVNSPAFKFKEGMFAAIKKRRKEFDEGINNPEVNQAIKRAIEAIKDNLKRKNLKAEDLDEKYRNYHNYINGLTKVWKIRDFRDEVIENIKTISRRKNYQEKSSHIEQSPKEFSWKDLLFFRSSNNN
jgi:curved DNA-binding protein CbpA